MIQITSVFIYENFLKAISLETLVLDDEPAVEFEDYSLPIDIDNSNIYEVCKKNSKVFIYFSIPLYQNWFEAILKIHP